VDICLHYVSMKAMCGHLVALCCSMKVMCGHLVASCKYEGDVWTFGCIM